MASAISPQEAAEAAKKILGFYATIPASDPEGFAAGLVRTLMIFPSAVIARAVDPVHGLPSKVKFLNLAAIREHLDEWDAAERESERRRNFAEMKRLPEPERDPEAVKRIGDGFKSLSEHLARGFSPSTAE